MKEFFEPTALSESSKVLIRQAIEIVDDYRTRGFILTLRQLYYQLVSKALIPNTEQSYKRVGSIISDARLCGYIDWSMIEDRGRSCAVPNHLDDPEDIMDRCVDWFSKDLWEDQPWWILVMIEKDALSGFFDTVCSEAGVTFAANKGYSSSSQMLRIGKDIESQMRNGKDICIYYLGDHDPSGLDMTRDVEERLKLFSGYTFWAPRKTKDEDKDYWDKAITGLNPRHFQLYRNAKYEDRKFEVNRLALTMDQINEFNPPPNPAKVTDSRAKNYIELYGEDSWELDALDPDVMVSLVTDGIAALKDDELWEEATERMEEERRRFKACLDTADRELL